MDHRVATLAGGAEALDIIINNDSDDDNFGVPVGLISRSVSSSSASEITDEDEHPRSDSNLKLSRSQTEHDMAPFDLNHDEIT